MVKIKWLSASRDDLKDIFDYISQDSKKYAKYQIFNIKDKVTLLKTQPFLGKIVSEFNDPNIREIVYSHYRIVYRILDDNLIHVLLIHHGARQFPRE